MPLCVFTALATKVDNVKEENLRLKEENLVLGQYIEGLLKASNMFQPADGAPKSHWTLSTSRTVHNPKSQVITASLHPIQ